jgi:aquaporin Z
MKKITEQMVAEFLGTMALVFIGAGSVVVLLAQFGDGSAIVGIALAHGLVLAVMVSNLGHISGAHFNPAVTLGVWVAGKIETIRAGVYVLSQVVGAIAGAALLRWVMPEAIWRSTSLGVPQVAHAAGFTNGKAVLLETILTFFLVITVFASAIDERGVFKSVAGLTIGLVLTFDILVGGTITGAAMNPARWFGPALIAGKWTDWWVYLIGPAIGAVLAASVFLFAFLKDREPEPPSMTGSDAGEEAEA